MRGAGVLGAVLVGLPDGEGGVDIHVATQWLHVDRDQVAPCLGLRPEQVSVGDVIQVLNIGGVLGICDSVNPDKGQPFNARVLGCVLQFPFLGERIGVLPEPEARIVGGAPRRTPEALEIRAFAASDIPWVDVAFATSFWALRDWGFKAVIAPRFGDIFRNNSTKLT